MSVPSHAPLRPDSGRSSADTSAASNGLSDVERHILQSLQDIRFGTLEIVIHDSRVVQVERSEKVRFDTKGKPLSDSLS